MITAPQLLHAALGNPPGKWPLEPHTGLCCTCGAPITKGVEFEANINLKTFSNHTTLTRWGTHACPACAWLYSDAKSKHRAWAAAGNTAWFPMINNDSATSERPQWLTTLRALNDLPPSTPIAMLITTDPKPRLWHHVLISSPPTPLAYLHNPDLDISCNVRIHLPTVINHALLIGAAMHLGFSKRSAQLGLYREHRRMLKQPAAITLETFMQPHRGTPEYNVALTIAQKENHLELTDAPRNANASGTARRETPPTQHRLL